MHREGAKWISKTFNAFTILVLIQCRNYTTTKHSINCIERSELHLIDNHNSTRQPIISAEGDMETTTQVGTQTVLDKVLTDTIYFGESLIDTVIPKSFNPYRGEFE